MKKDLIAISVISILVFACILPLETTQSPAAPTTDSSALLTFVVQTIQAASTQTQAVITPSNTPAPTETINPPTATLMPPTAVLPEAGTFLVRLENGTTQFFDQTAGYELIIPTNWIAIRVKGPEYFEALKMAELAASEFQAALKNTQKQNEDVFRLFAFNMEESNATSPFIMNMNLVWDQQDESSLEEVVKKIESQYPKIFPGIQITNLDIAPTAKNIPGGVIESIWVTKNASGQEFSIYQKQVVFKLHRGTLTITLSVPGQLKDATIPYLDFVVNNLIVK